MSETFSRAGQVALLFAVFAVLAGCGGGGGSHTYITAANVTGGPGAGASGVYVTIVSPVALPRDLLIDAKQTATFVHRARGPQRCSRSAKVGGLKGQNAFLNGKTLTIKLNGSYSLIGLACAALAKNGFNPQTLGGDPSAWGTPP